MDSSPTARVFKDKVRAAASKDRREREAAREKQAAQAREDWAGRLIRAVLRIEPPELKCAAETVNARGCEPYTFEVENLTFQVERENGSQCPWRRLHLIARNGKQVENRPWIRCLADLDEYV